MMSARGVYPQGVEKFIGYLGLMIYWSVLVLPLWIGGQVWGLLEDRLGFDWAGMLALMAIICSAIGIILLGSWLSEYPDRTSQQRRDMLAGDIEAFLSEGHEADFGLYLRPFGGDEQFLLRSDSPGLTDRTDNLEILVWRAVLLAGLPPPLCIEARPDVTFGSGRVEKSDGADADSDWKARVKRLAESAAYIIMIPAPSDGCIWEMTLLKDEELFDKAVWIQPVHKGRSEAIQSDGSRPALEYRQEWEHARTTAREEADIVLPEFSPFLMVFAFENGSREPFSSVPVNRYLHEPQVSDLAACFRGFLPEARRPLV